MAPPSTSLSRLGQINKAGADDALFLEQFGGEILTEFNRVNVFKERHFVRQISNGNLPKHLKRGLAPLASVLCIVAKLMSDGYLSGAAKIARRELTIGRVLTNSPPTTKIAPPITPHT